MTLPNGGDVLINNVAYMIDESVEEHYRHNPADSVMVPRVDISGSPGKSGVHQEKLLWSMDDWSGGEGNNIFSVDDPTTYDYSTRLNGRLPGQLTGRPARTSISPASGTNDGDQRCYLDIGQGRLWLAGADVTKFSNDYGDSFSNAANGITAGDKITSTAGSDEHLYYATGDASNHEIRRTNAAGTNAAVVTRAAGQRYVGQCFFNGRVYAWTGRKLWELDVAETVPLTVDDTYRKVYDTGTELDYANFGGSSQGSWWADVVPTDTSIVFFVGTEGNTRIYEFKNGVGRPLWTPPFGFTCKSMTFQNGILYAGGHWGGEGTANGFGCMYALVMNTRQEIFIGWFRKNQGSNLQMQEMGNSYGSQILLGAAKSGKIFIYDADFDGISLLDDLDRATDATGWDSNSKIGDILTIGPRRVVAHFQPGDADADDYYVHTYVNDELTNRESVGSLTDTLDSSEWDFDFPHEVKALMGLHVTYKVEDAATASGLLANQRIKVSYSLDGAAYVDAGTVTSATVVGTKGRAFVQVSTSSSTKKFFRLRVQVTLDNNATTGVKQPVLYGCTSEAQLLSYRETWDLVLRVKDEDGTTAPRNGRKRPRNRQFKSNVLRDNLVTLAQNRNLVQLLDAYRYRENNRYTTHTIFVDEAIDVIERNAEGSMRVRLRSVPT